MIVPENPRQEVFVIPGVSDFSLANQQFRSFVDNALQKVSDLEGLTDEEKSKTTERLQALKAHYN